MQTTLRINDGIYRQAKAEAAREGITLTRFIEEALALRLQGAASLVPLPLPTFRGGASCPPDFDLFAEVQRTQIASDEKLARRLLE